MEDSLIQILAIIELSGILGIKKLNIRRNNMHNEVANGMMYTLFFGILMVVIVAYIRW